MKRLLYLVAALASSLVLNPYSSAQQSCPTCPAGVVALAHCPAVTLEECPAEGCGGWDRQLNCRKNLTCDPAGHTPEKSTLDDIKRLLYPQGWHGGKDRADLVGLGEGRHISVTARLYRAEQGLPDFANCKLDGPQDKDILLLLVPDGALKKKQTAPQREALSVTAALTPRVRRAHKSWTMDSLGRLLSYGPVYVRVTGLLLLDTTGSPALVERGRPRRVEPLVRATDWEIHPILELEVCRSKKCADAGGWEKLDDMRIPPWPPGVKDSGRDEDAEGPDAGPIILSPRRIYKRSPTPVRRARGGRARRD